MKKSILLIAILFGIAGISRAQTPLDNYSADTKLGAVFTGGAAFSAGTAAQGAKTSGGFSYSAGADADFPFSRTAALNVALVYDVRQFSFNPQNGEDFNYTYRLGYLSIRPSFRYSYFTLGAGIGFPATSATTISYNAGGISAVGSSGTNLAQSDINLLLEIRLGSCIPLIESKTGQLDLTGEVSYAFTNIISDGPMAYAAPSQNPSNTSNNGPLASVEIGLKYLFDLSSH